MKLGATKKQNSGTLSARLRRFIYTYSYLFPATTALLLVTIFPTVYMTYLSISQWKAFLLDQALVGAFILPSLGIHIGSILGNPLNALIAVVFVDVWTKAPFMFLIILAGLQGISPSLYRAAKIDGAGALSSFRHITLPLLRKVLIIAVILKV